MIKNLVLIAVVCGWLLFCTIFEVNKLIAAVVPIICVFICVSIEIFIQKKLRIRERKFDKSADFIAKAAKAGVSNEVALAVFNYFSANYNLPPRITDNLEEIYELVLEKKITKIIQEIIKSLGQETDFVFSFEENDIAGIKGLSRLIQKQYDALIANN